VKFFKRRRHAGSLTRAITKTGLDADEPNQQGSGHQTSEINLRVVTWTAIVLMISVLAVYVTVGGLFSLFKRQYASESAPSRITTPGRLPPAPQLQTSPPADLQQLLEELAQARKWLAKTGAALDGIIAKRRDMSYRSGERDGMQKIKNFRSADCVVGGFRYAASSKVVGSLLLGLYNVKGLLDHVGFTSSMAAADRPELTKKLERLIEPPGIHWKRSWRAKSLESRKGKCLAAAKASSSGRSAL
jgi:hypothetical protein